jgi:hypothetical protein
VIGEGDAATAKILELNAEHPFWGYETIATALREFGIAVSAFYVSWVLGGERGVPQ